MWRKEVLAREWQHGSRGPDREGKRHPGPLYGSCRRVGGYPCTEANTLEVLVAGEVEVAATPRLNAGGGPLARFGDLGLLRLGVGDARRVGKGVRSHFGSSKA